MAIQVARGTVTLANGVATSTISLPAGITQNKSFPIISIRGENVVTNSHACSATLQTPSGGEWTELLIERGQTSLAVEVSWEVWYGPELTVQQGFATLLNSGSEVQKDVTISAVTLSTAFVVVQPRRVSASGADISDVHIRGKLTSTTNLQLNREDFTQDCGASWYVVEISGAFVQSGSVTFAGTASQGATLGTPVVMANSILIYSSSSATTSRPDRAMVLGQLTSTTALTFDKKDPSTEGNGSVDWFVIEHADFTVQRGTKTLADTVGSDTQTVTAVADTAKTALVTNWYGSVNSDATDLNTCDDANVMQVLTNTTTLTFTRYGTALATYVGWQVVEFASSYTPAVIAREGADIAAAEQTDTQADVRVTSVDGTAARHRLYGHTSDLGATPSAWTGTATLLDSTIVANDLIPWGSRAANTPYYFAIVTDDGAGGGEVLSNVLPITTAYARPTAVGLVSKTANSIKISGTDQSGGAADHWAMYKPAGDPLSSLQLAGVVGAGLTLEFDFGGLDPATSYDLGFVTSAGETPDRLSGFASTTQSTGGVPIRILTHHYRQMAAIL